MSYEIQQFTHGYGWEPIPEGEFDTAELAEAALHDLEDKLEWANLRIVCGETVILEGRLA